MTQEACAGGKCAAGRTLAGVRVNALTGDSVVHRHDCQFAQRLLRMTTKKAVAQAQYPRPGRVRAADLCNGLPGKAEFIICRADHANSILPDHIRPFAEAVIRQELQTSGRLIIDIVMPGQIDRPCKIRLFVCILLTQCVKIAARTASASASSDPRCAGRQSASSCNARQTSTLSYVRYGCTISSSVGCRNVS